MSSSDDELPRVYFRSRGPTAPLGSSSSLPRPPSSEEVIILEDDPPQVSRKSLIPPRTRANNTAPTSGSESASQLKGDPPVSPGRAKGVKRSHVTVDKGMDQSPEARMKRNREEAMEKLKTKKLKHERLELEKERVRLEKAQARETKKKEKEFDCALREATKETNKDSSPGQRLKHMVVILDSTLSENRDFMGFFATALKSLSVKYRLNSSEEPGVVRWGRTLTERDVSKNAEVIRHEVEVEEKEVLLTLEAQGFVGLVHYSKQALLGHPLPEGAVTLEHYVEKFCNENPGKRISLAVEGIEAFLRGHKTRVNRQFRQAVLNSDPGSSSSGGGHAPKRTQKRVPTKAMFSDVSRVECEEALVRLQLRSGCVARMCEDGEQLAGHVVALTKAISESHYQRENPFSFYAESGQGPSKKDLETTDNKVALIWRHQLAQFNQLSGNMAAAVVSMYPSPGHLLQAYERCTDQEDARLLLANISIRRGVGVTSTTRRLGPVQSKRIHTLMTSTDPKLKLP